MQVSGRHWQSEVATGGLSSVKTLKFLLVLGLGVKPLGIRATIPVLYSYQPEGLSQTSVG